MKSKEIDSGGPSHPEVEVARDGEVAGERGILEVPHARRTHTGFGEPVVEPRGRAIAEIRAYRLMNRAEHLKQHEDRAGKRKRAGERIAALHGADEHAHRNRERRRQGPSQQEGYPPSGGEAKIRLWQNAEELPFLALGQRLQHDRILPQNASAHRPRVSARGCVLRAKELTEAVAGGRPAAWVRGQRTIARESGTKLLRCG